MLRKLGILGLSVPLLAILAALVYLLLFGTDEPTFDAATRELARDHTVIQLRDQPPAALIAPAQPPDAAILIIVLPDDQRHIWTAARRLGLLDYLDRHRLALLIAPGVSEAAALESLVADARNYLPVQRAVLAAFDGDPIRDLCPQWPHVIIIARNQDEAQPPCADAAIIPPGDDLAQPILNAIQTIRDAP